MISVSNVTASDDNIEPNSLALVDGLAIMCRMTYDQEHGDDAGKHGTYAADDQAKRVEGNAAIPKIRFHDCCKSVRSKRGGFLSKSALV